MSATPPTVIVNFDVEIDAKGELKILSDVAPSMTNVIVADKKLPASALYRAASGEVAENSLFEFYEPLTPGDIEADLATHQSRNWKLLARSLANGIQDCLEDDFSAIHIVDPNDLTKNTIASPFNDAKYAAVDQTFTNFGDFALSVYAHHIMGHASATAGITNDVAFVQAMLSQNALGVYPEYTSAQLLVACGDNEFGSEVAAGSAANANLAKLLVKAIVGKSVTDITKIAKQVVSQDTSRAMNQDNSKDSPDTRQSLKFIAGDIIFMNIKLKQPTVTIGTGQQVSSTTLSAKFGTAAEISYSLKITLE
jgi:hypothetical protein